MTPLDERIRPGVFLSTGHRGASGLAPENTLPSFALALEHQVDVLELDVHATACGEIVVIHDPTVERTTDGAGRVAELPYASLRALDAGYRFSPDGGASHPFRGQGVRIPRLVELFAAFPETVFTVELKPSPHRDYLPRVAELIRSHAPGRVIVGSFTHALLQGFRALAPEVPTSCSGKEIRSLFLLSKCGLKRLFRSPARLLQIPPTSGGERRTGIRIATRGFVRTAQRSGRPVQVWTVNDPVEMRELIALGVDGLTTDRPDLLRDVLAEER